MTAHNIKTFKKRGPVVLCRLPLTLIVGNGGMNVHQWQRLFLCFFHNSYTPVNICRKTITQVVRNLLRQISARIKSLMAHKHTMTERAPREFFWRCKPSPAHIVAVIIHPVGITYSTPGSGFPSLLHSSRRALAAITSNVSADGKKSPALRKHT